MNPCVPHHKVVMVPHASIISESEVSITVLCLLCSSHYTAVQIEKHVYNQCNHYEKYDGRMLQLSSEAELSIALLCQLCSTCYTIVRIKNCLKSTFEIMVATMRNTDNFSLCKGSHHMQPPN